MPQGILGRSYKVKQKQTVHLVIAHTPILLTYDCILLREASERREREPCRHPLKMSNFTHCHCSSPSSWLSTEKEQMIASGHVACRYFAQGILDPTLIGLHICHLRQTFNLSKSETWLFQTMPSAWCRRGISFYLSPVQSPVLIFPTVSWDGLESPRTRSALSFVVAQTWLYTCQKLNDTKTLSKSLVFVRAFAYRAVSQIKDLPDAS